MIWGETREQRAARLNAGSPAIWFAWHPVTLSDGRKAWLHWVKRHRHSGWAWWVYQAVE